MLNIEKLVNISILENILQLDESAINGSTIPDYRKINQNQEETNGLIDI